MKDDAKVSMIIIFIITLIILSVIPLTVQSITFENSYGKLEVYPDISRNIIRQKQYFNVTSYLPSQNLDIAFRFNESLTYGSVYNWNGSNYNKVDVEHIEYNGKHWYLLNDIYFNQDETKKGYWEYDTLINSSGKWDMFIKRSSDSLEVAIQNNLYVHLDPWWSSDFELLNSSYICDAVVDYSVNYNFTYSDEFSSNCLANFSDVYFVNDDNDTVLDFWIEEVSNGSYLNVWINISDSNQLNVYYNSTIYNDIWLRSNGSNTFLFFDDFNDDSLNTDLWEVDLGTPYESDGYIFIEGSSGETLISKNSYLADLRIKGSIKQIEADSQFIFSEVNPYDNARKFGIGSTDLGNYDRLMLMNYDTGGGGVSYKDPCSPLWNSGYIDYEMLWVDDTSVKMYYGNDGLVKTSTTYVLDTEGYLCFNVWNTNGNISADWVFMSKYSIITEPSFCNWSGEISKPPPFILSSPTPLNNAIDVICLNVSDVCINFNSTVSIALLNMSFNNTDFIEWDTQDANIDNGTYCLNITGNLTGLITYNWAVNIYYNTVWYNYSYNFTCAEGCACEDELEVLNYKLDNIYDNMIKGDDELDISIGLDGTFLTLVLFAVFFIVGYTINKRSGGILMIFSGFTLIAFEFLVSSVLNVFLVIPLLSPIAILIIILGIRKWLYPVENEKTKSEGT